MKIFLLCSLVVLSSQASFAHDSNQDGVFKLNPIKAGFDAVTGQGGNLLLISGEDGTVMIDDDYLRNGSDLAHFLKDEDKMPKFLINTHWHGDHTGGNKVLGEKSTIIAHENVRERLSTAQEIPLFNVKFDPQPKVALPVITYENKMTIHANGQDITLRYYADSHTDSDSAVFIQPANIIHTGDLYFAGSFPFIDADTKGKVKNVITSLKDISSRIDGQTVIVPGHGDLSNQSELQNYIMMLEASVKVAEGYKSQGLDLAAAQAAGLPAELVEKWGNGFINADTWMLILYETL